jgi:hypothetical protein
MASSSYGRPKRPKVAHIGRGKRGSKIRAGKGVKKVKTTTIVSK